MNRNILAVLSLLALSCGIWWKPILRTIALAWHSDEYTHILLILPISVVLILMERQRLRKAIGWDIDAGVPILGVALLIEVGATLWRGERATGAPLSVVIFALVLLWIGIFVLCLGRRACGQVLLPLFFLFGLVPLPRSAVDPIITGLQEGSVWSTHALFALVNVPVSQQGVHLMIPGLTIEVARECSSIRSSSILVVISILAAHVLLRSKWNKVLIVVLAVPLSIAKNGLRIFAIAFLGSRVDPSYLNGKLHQQGGILFLLLALIAEWCLLIMLRRRETSLSVNKSPRLSSESVNERRARSVREVTESSMGI